MAFGRASVIWTAVSETGDELIIKLFRGTPRSAKRKDALSDFQRETKAHAKLSHPNILPILDWGVDSVDLETAPFLVLPYCKYGDLRQEIQAQSFIPFERSIRILQQLAAAVDYAHSCGILHGDIKPENVLFWQSQDNACLADFGASRYYPQNVVVSAEAGGTADYTSPEELKGRRATPASDLYSFALVAFEILTGVLPYDHSVAYDSMQSRLSGDLDDALTRNPLLPSRVTPAFVAAFAPNPALRPRSATSFVQSLLTEPVAGKPTLAATTTEKTPRETNSGESRFTPAQRIALWTAIIGAIVTIVTAIIAILPSLVSKEPSTSEAPASQRR
jgi:serine/threonine-protein kinase